MQGFFPGFHNPSVAEEDQGRQHGKNADQADNDAEYKNQKQHCADDIERQIVS